MADGIRGWMRERDRYLPARRHRSIRVRCGILMSSVVINDKSIMMSAIRMGGMRVRT